MQATNAQTTLAREAGRLSVALPLTLKTTKLQSQPPNSAQLPIDENNSTDNWVCHTQTETGRLLRAKAWAKIKLRAANSCRSRSKGSLYATV